ncbi:hypothetical protein F0L68_05395 [Solihabitans fulvus]|uniref:SUKH-3 immunity protein n=1 Tax=Solihabitans fulvus TaxID=1892852 RepID=A0A5B2XP09_9PSEU|nr:SUKH-3 domain-containing protein [Solihabitans fulvus]KAA2265096.1 hypothetical protein F0L68_05395 [Solihabitans fulvus]
MAVVDSFSPEVVRALTASGWEPGRHVDVEPWDRVLRSEGYHLSELVRDLLESLGGLRVHPVGQGEYRAALLFEPELAGSGAYDIAEELEDMFHQRFYPVAEWISNSCVFVGERGQVASYDDIEMLDLGNTVNDAVELIVVCSRPPRVIRSVH